jgi:hypothetical protein
MSDKLFPILHSLVKSYIVEIRQHPVIVDADVAALYGVETKRVNEAVKNNPDKFPEDYMFVLTSDESKDLRSKFSTTNLSAKSRPLTQLRAVFFSEPVIGNKPANCKITINN